MKDEVFTFLRSMDGAGIRFAIGGSYALRHLRPPRDLDIFIPDEDWHRVLAYNNKIVRSVEPSGDDVCVFAWDGFEVEVYHSGYPLGFDYETMEPDFVRDEHGFHCWSVDQTIAWKQAMGRPKDRRDIELLRRASRT